MEDKNGEHFRPCDRELLRRGIPFFPITLGPMRLFTKRGIHLKRVLTRRGYLVIEVYPGAAQDIWNTGRKQDGLSKLRKGLQKLGVKGSNEKMSGDELDSVTAALVGQLFLRGKAEVLGHFAWCHRDSLHQRDGLTLSAAHPAKRSDCPAISFCA